MAGFNNDVVYGSNIDLTGNPNPAPTMVSDGQLMIASTALNANGTHVNVGNIISPAGTVTLGYSSPNIIIDTASTIPNSFITNSGTAIPSGHTLNVVGGTNVTTSASGNTITITSSGGGFTPNSTVQLSDDFIGWSYTAASTSINSNYSWIESGQGFHNAVTAIDNGHPGCITHPQLTGTQNSFLQLADGALANPSIICTGGTLDIFFVLNITDFTTLSPLFGIATGGLTSWVGVRLNTVWTLSTFLGGAHNDNNSAISVTNGWHNVHLSISADGKQIKFFVDGVLGLTYNFPGDYATLPTAPMSPLFYVQNNGVGTTLAGNVTLDLFYMTQTLTTPR